MEEGVIKVVSYIRESTYGQTFNGHRPAVQRDHIGSYCKKHNFQMVKEFEDSGSGGDLKKRPRFIEMVQFLKQNKDIPFIIIDEMSRYFRNTKEGLGYFDDLAKEGIIVLDTEIDYSPREYLEKGGIPVGQWKNRTTALVDAEFELRRTKVRVKSGYEKKASSAMYVGPLAFGMEWKNEYKKYVGYHPKESLMVIEVFKLYLTGQYGFTKLARHLNNAGYARTEIERRPEVVGGGRIMKRYEVKKPFTLETVRTILTNKSYIGKQNTHPYLPLLTLDNNNCPTTLSPLISEDDFNRVQQMIQGNTRGVSRTGTKESSRQKSVFLLQGIGYSGVNGSKLHGQTETTGLQKPCRRYFPSTNKSGNDNHIPSMRADDVEDKIIELLRFIKIRGISEIEKILRDIIDLAAEQKNTHMPPAAVFELKKAIKALTVVQKSSYSYTNDIHIKDLKKQLEEIEGQKPDAEQMKYYDFIELRNVLSDIVESFKRLQSLAAKKELLDILFSKLFVGEEPMVGVKPFMPPSAYAKVTQSPEVTEAKELKALVQKFVPYLFEKIYIKKEVDIVNVSFKPTGLFLLLNEPQQQNEAKPDSLPNPVPSAPSGGILGGNCRGTFSAHH